MNHTDTFKMGLIYIKSWMHSLMALLLKYSVFCVTVIMDLQFGSLIWSGIFKMKHTSPKWRYFTMSTSMVSQSTSQWKIRFTNMGNLWMTSKWETMGFPQIKGTVCGDCLGERAIGKIRIQYGEAWPPRLVEHHNLPWLPETRQCPWWLCLYCAVPCHPG